MYRKIVLDNGLRVVTERMPLSQLITVGISSSRGQKERAEQSAPPHMRDDSLKIVEVRG